MENSNNLTPFEGEKIRKLWHEEQWYFSVVDVIATLTDSNNANRYWSDLKRKMEKESGQSYDLIVRLNLPRKDGREVLVEIRADERLQRIPVVVLTTSEAEEDILKAYNLHANCYITKPVDFNQFVRIIQSIEDFWFTIVQLPPE